MGLLELLKALFGQKYLNKIIGTRTNVAKPIRMDKDSPFKQYSDSAFDDPKVLSYIEKKIDEYGPYALNNKNPQELANFESNAKRLLASKNKQTGSTPGMAESMKPKPEAEIVDIATQKPVSEKGIATLKSEIGLPEGVEPGSIADKAIKESAEYKMNQQGVKSLLDENYKAPKTTSIADDMSLDEALEKELSLEEVSKIGDEIKASKMSEQGAKAYSANIESYRRPIIRQMLLKDTRINLSDDVRKSLENKDDLQRGADPKMDPLRLLDEYYDVNFDKLDELEEIRFTARNESEAADEFLQKGGLKPKELGDKLKDYDGDPDGLAEGGRIGFAGGGIKDLIKKLNKKFGKGTVTTAENMELSPNVLQKKMFEDFNKRNTKLSYADKDKRIIPEGLTEEDIDLAILKGEFERKYSKLIPEDLMKTIMADEDPQRVKDIIGHVEQAAIMRDKGMSADQIVDAFKAGEKRKDNADGGLNYLMGL